MFTIAVSSRALFNMEASHDVFVKGGQKAFEQFQRDSEDTPLEPGVAFALVKKFLAFNSPGIRDQVEVVLLSRNSPDAGMRVMRAISDYGLDIEQAIFTQGGDRFAFAEAFNVDLFLSVNSDDVRTALKNGVTAAAMLIHGEAAAGDDDDSITVAFDGDSVLFSDEAERIFQQHGLDHFQKSEREQAGVPLPDGPFRKLLMALSELKAKSPPGKVKIKLLLVTARGIPAQERVIRTLRSWNISLDAAAFCGGKPKGPILLAFGADIFFDDTMKHCENATASSVPAGHVPSGITNEVAHEEVA